MKRVVGVVMLAALCTLPAHGESTELTSSIRHALTPIGSTPTKADIAALFPQDTVDRLSAIALDGTEDFGVRLRAIRALPDFCLPACANTPAFASLVAVLASSVPDHAGQTILLQRAGLEALGRSRANAPGDVDRVLDFLNNPNRDLRVAAAFALRDLCRASAIQPLRDRYNIETVMQVRLAISAALRDLNTCTN